MSSLRTHSAAPTGARPLSSVASLRCGTAGSPRNAIERLEELCLEVTSAITGSAANACATERSLPGSQSCAPSDGGACMAMLVLKALAEYTRALLAVRISLRTRLGNGQRMFCEPSHCRHDELIKGETRVGRRRRRTQGRRCRNSG